MEIKNISVILLITILIGILVFLYIKLVIGSPRDTTKTVIKPFENSIKVDCKTVRTSCDLSDPTSCESKCNNTEEMICMDLNSLNNTQDLNKGGAGIGVCVPYKPNIECNINNGGAYVWSGYGFTNKQEWSCVCNKPTYYSGPSCENKNPAFCANGNIDTNLDPTDINACICNKTGFSKKMQWPDTNLPFCADDKLYGNITTWPNWQNVYVNTNTVSNPNQWATDIAKEMYSPDSYLQNVEAIQNILVKFNIGQTQPQHLTQDIISVLCSKNSLATKGSSSICSTKLPNNFIPVTTYTYYSGAEIV
jgi:hypothetical protein